VYVNEGMNRGKEWVVRSKGGGDMEGNRVPYVDVRLSSANYARSPLGKKERGRNKDIAKKRDSLCSSLQGGGGRLDKGENWENQGGRAQRDIQRDMGEGASVFLQQPCLPHRKEKVLGKTSRTYLFRSFCIDIGEERDRCRPKGEIRRCGVSTMNAGEVRAMQ